ncbi:MAG: hypothetical protein OEZ07_00110 [Dehalococcoidia bacterium]|nr:hypothetical protein [Dehalococcoidia bacterium]MDH5780963.1 hypothetical protein [Dehalococcoidia bacterium]
MTLGTLADSKIKKLNWVDIQFIKMSVAGCILMIAKLWEPLLSLDWYWYAIIFVLAAIKPAYKVLGK